MQRVSGKRNSLDMEEYDNIWERDPPRFEGRARRTQALIGGRGNLGFESPETGWKISLVVASLFVIIYSIKFKLNLLIH